MLFIDEDIMQDEARALARKLNKIPTTKQQRRAFINDTVIPENWHLTIQKSLSKIDPNHHYVLLSYVRLFLGEG